MGAKEDAGWWRNVECTWNGERRWRGGCRWNRNVTSDLHKGISEGGRLIKGNEKR